jgi:F-type H+-transporting ATPase subunit b
MKWEFFTRSFQKSRSLALRGMTSRALFMKVAPVCLSTVLFLSAAMSAPAAEEAGNPAERTMVVLFKWIHFVILAGLAYWLFAKVLPPVFRRHADNIGDAVTKATAAKAEAERQLNEALRRLASLDKEVAKFRALAQREAQAELERLRVVTQSDIEKIAAAGKIEIEAAERAARVELKTLAAKLAVDRAETLIAKQMTTAVQEAMINSFVQSLERRPN